MLQFMGSQRVGLNDWTHLTEGPRRIRQWQPTPVLLPEEFHGWRSLVGCNPWGR